VYPIEFEYIRSEMNTQFTNIATPNEVVVATTFIVELGPVSGEMHVCMPYAMIEPIRDLMTSSLQGETLEVDRRWIRLLTQQIKTADVEVVTDLGHVNSTLGALLELKAGDILPFTLEPTLEAKVDGVPVFECSYGQINGQYALRVERMINSSQELQAGEDHGK
jgi:flagellar motor switch protein FliM